MKIQSFLKYVEIQTKLASMISLLLGTVLALYRYKAFNAGNFLLMLLSLLCIDMTTTAINNYMDFKNARKKSGYGYEKHNAIVRDNIREPAAVAVIVVLLAVSVGAGFMLFLRTNVVVLVLGIISFSVGVLYSAGPVPISRTPFGEVFSGLFMGFFIPFLSAYIHVADKNIIGLLFENTVFTFRADVLEAASIFIASTPAVAGIANIMLANNICDMEDDLENRRYTLPLYIGKEKALLLFKWIYFIAYLSVIVGIATKIIPLTGLLFFLTFIPVRRNIRTFEQKQSKAGTFGLSVMNFTVMNAALILVFALGILLNML
jgi:1,4-dihydroxy-2-naphthoate octaprenyltransferase